MGRKAVETFICLLMAVSIMLSPLLQNIRGVSTGGDDLVQHDLRAHASRTASLTQKTQLSFAAFTDTHIGIRYQNPYYGTADHLDRLGDDLTNGTNLLDFAVHLGDIVNLDTAQVNGAGLPWVVNQYKNDLKAYLISHVNLPFFAVLGNHDLDDYLMNYANPHYLTTALINELSMNNPVYAMMRSGILFLVVPELGYITWTHPVEYEWIRYMTRQYPTTTTIILSHQAIEDTTKADSTEPYWGKQDMDFWATLFQQNPQIKLWVHGHTHEPDWFEGSHSTGETHPIRDFGHTMVFSSPYPQMSWNNDSDEDRIVIYNLSADGVTTGAWEDTGTGGHWTPGYTHSWNISTTFDPTATNWYSYPMFLQDNETQLTDMKVLSPAVTLQLVGTEPMELFFDPRMESPSSKEAIHEVILGFGNDRSGNVNWTNPGMRVHGPTFLTFPEKLPHHRLQEDGRSGQPYHSFPMGTIGAAVPGQTYNVTITARCSSGNGTMRLTMECSDWAKQNQYSILMNSSHQVITHTFGPIYETITGSYTVPKNPNAWFLQGRLDFLNSTDYDVALFSVKRQRTTDTTDMFRLNLNGHWYNASGPLVDDEAMNFTVDPVNLSDDQGVMNFTAFIQGNRYGMVNLVYHEPVLLGMNARFRVDGYQDGVFHLSLTKTITGTSPVAMRLWNSTFFTTHPILANLLVYFLSSTLLDWLMPSTFKLYPFSTDPMYSQVTVTADDESGVTHITNNGNLWFSCNGPLLAERKVQVTLP
ncbi:MAG TPA: metallophosphoesterase, partial [Candidatus Thermoplasmatota archaeon]|nr:metallophosphoesterase [Candidatus Thermoplasmatota archaeon]